MSVKSEESDGGREGNEREREMKRNEHNNPPPGTMSVEFLGSLDAGTGEGEREDERDEISVLSSLGEKKEMRERGKLTTSPSKSVHPNSRRKRLDLTCVLRRE